MLPDFINFKKKVKAQLTKYLQSKMQNSSFIGQISRKPQHEGKTLISHTFDGHQDNITYQEISSGFTITKHDIILMGIDAFKEHIDKMALTMSDQQAKIFFQKLEKVTEKTGKVINAPGSCPQEAILKALDTIPVDFDESGKPDGLTFILPPNLKEKILALNQDIEFAKKWNALLDRKRSEWRARESHRKLVD